jgi:hypothetical protein
MIALLIKKIFISFQICLMYYGFFQYFEKVFAIAQERTSSLNFFSELINKLYKFIFPVEINSGFLVV